MTFGGPILLYIDFATGSLVFQIIVGGLLGSLFLIRSIIFTWVRRIKMIFVRGPADAYHNPPEEESQGP
jgi:uncharacterized membrane protein YedE/YeeE